MTRLNDILDESLRALSDDDMDALVRDGKLFSETLYADGELKIERIDPHPYVHPRDRAMTNETRWIAQHAAEAGEMVRIAGQNANGTANLTHWAGVMARCDIAAGEEVELVEIDGWLFATDKRPDFSSAFTMALQSRTPKIADMITNSNAIIRGEKPFVAEDFNFSKPHDGLKVETADPRTKPHEPPLPQLFIRRGERVLWDGALICEAKHDILNTDTLDVDAFRWFVTKPKPYEEARETRGFRDADVGGGRMVVEVFVEGEWRRPTPLSP